MKLIDADARVTVQSFDVEHEEYDYTEMSVEEALDFGTDEGCPPVIDAVLVVRCKDCMYWRETGEGIGECERLEVADSDPEIVHAFQSAHDWFCADGERADSPTCGPDYCEIGGDRQ